jgi:rhomboid family protein
VPSVIPLSDASRRPRHFPYVTLLIILLNILVFVRELIGGEAFVASWAVIPAEIASGQHLVTLFSSMFMHASLSHIVGNMVFLWAFGPEIEDAMNPARYSIFYVLGGLAASAAQVAVTPHSTVPNLGASGAIAAVMGAFLVTYPRDRIRALLVIFVFVRVRYIPAALLIGVWFLTQLVNLGTVASVQTGGIAYMAHIGGMVFGALTARLFVDPARVAQRWAA